MAAAAAQLSILIAAVLTKPEEVQRRVGALVGAVVADAASQHLEWIYDQGQLTRIVGDKNPEFWPENKCPFFNIPNGKLTCYGDEVMTTLNTLEDKSDVTVDEKKLLEAIQFTFGRADSAYQIAQGQGKKTPLNGPWLNSAVKKGLVNIANGKSPTGDKNNHDPDGFCLALPVIFRTSSSSDFDATIKPILQVLTTNEETLANNEVQTRLVQAYVENHPDPIGKIKDDFREKFPDIVKDIEAVEEFKATGATTANLVQNFGLSCHLPGSFHSVLAFLIDAKSYVSAIRENIMAGGDSSSRSVIIGACLGAKFGLQSIPVEWLEKVDNMTEIIQRAEEVYQ